MRWQRTQKDTDQIVYAPEHEQKELRVYLNNHYDNAIILAYAEPSTFASLYMPLTDWETTWNNMRVGDQQEQYLRISDTVNAVDRYRCRVRRDDNNLWLEDYDLSLEVTAGFACPPELEQLLLQDFPSLTFSANMLDITHNSFHDQDLATLLIPRTTASQQ